MKTSCLPLIFKSNPHLPANAISKTVVINPPSDLSWYANISNCLCKTIRVSKNDFKSLWEWTVGAEFPTCL